MRKGVLMIGAAATVGALRMAVEGMEKEKPKNVTYMEEVVRTVESMSVTELKFLIHGLEQRIGVCSSEFPFGNRRRGFELPPKKLGPAHLAKKSGNQIKR